MRVKFFARNGLISIILFILIIIICESQIICNPIYPSSSLQENKPLKSAQYISPSQFSFLSLTSDCCSVFLKENYAYLANGNNGLRIVSLTDPTVPEILASYYDGTDSSEDGFANDVIVENDYAFVADGLDGLEIINISNPLLPEKISEISPPGIFGYAKALVKNLTYLYIACGFEGLWVVSISNISNPQQLMHIPTDNYAKCVEIWNNYLFVGDSTSGLKIYNITDPATPNLIAIYGYDMEGMSANGIFIQNNLLYLAAGGLGLIVLNINNITNPVEMGRFDVNSENKPSVSWEWGANDVYVRDNLAYIADRYHGMEILDVSDPTNIIRMNKGSGAEYSEGWGSSIVVSEKFIYFCNLEKGFVLVDSGYDEDEDGLSDLQEVYLFNTNPQNYDSDGDGLSDGDELLLGTNPLLEDSDGDGIIDGSDWSPLNDFIPIGIFIISGVFIIITIGLVMILRKNRYLKREKDLKFQKFQHDQRILLNNELIKLKQLIRQQNYNDALEKITFLLSAAQQAQLFEIVSLLQKNEEICKTNQQFLEIGKKIWQMFESGKIQSAFDRYSDLISKIDIPPLNSLLEPLVKSQSLEAFSRIKEQLQETKSNLQKQLNNKFQELVAEQNFTELLSFLQEQLIQVNKSGFEDIENDISKRLLLLQKIVKLQKLMKISTRMNLVDVSSTLAMDRAEIISLILENHDTLPNIKVDGDYLVFTKETDLGIFLSMLDQDFATWESLEYSKEGKI